MLRHSPCSRSGWRWRPQVATDFPASRVGDRAQAIPSDCNVGTEARFGFVTRRRTLACTPCLCRDGALHVDASSATECLSTCDELSNLVRLPAVAPGSPIPSVSVMTSTRDVKPARLLSPPPPDMNLSVAPFRNWTDWTKPPRLPAPLLGS